MNLAILLDENVPREIALWLQSRRPDWRVTHVIEAGLGSKSDLEILTWAQTKQAIVITFDEDFADRRMFPVGSHAGVVRLRIWPTTVEETKLALTRLLDSVIDSDFVHSLIIIDQHRIRIRKL